MLIWHMVDEIIKIQGKVLSFIQLYSYTLCLLVKTKEVKLKNLHTSTCLDLNYGTTKQKQKM